MKITPHIYQLEIYSINIILNKKCGCGCGSNASRELLIIPHIKKGV